jgi:hypothetical protein
MVIKVGKTDSALHLSPRAGRGRIASSDAIRVRGSIRKRSRDCLKHASHVAENVVVSETHDTIIVLGEPFVANHILRVVSVLAAVDFNDQTRVAAYEIDGVRANRFLSDELVPVQPARSQAIPKRAFGIGRGLPEPPRAFGLNFFGTAQALSPPHPPRSARRPLPARGERQTYHKSA